MSYSNNTIRRVEQILGYGIKQAASSDRTYNIVNGVLYTDLFTGNITITGYDSTYTKAFNGHTNGVTYFNELILDDEHACGEVVVTAAWGSEEFNIDIDNLFSWVECKDPTNSLNTAGIASKKIEDFSVSYKSAEEKQNDLMSILNNGFGYYIRKPLIIDVSRKQKDAGRYF